MSRKVSLASVVLCAALVGACTSQERTITEDGVEIRAGRGEPAFTERHEIDLGAHRDLEAFREWASQKGFTLDAALYEVGYLGPPPSECSAACEVLMLHVGYDRLGQFSESYLVYVVNGSIVRIDNAFAYAPGIVG